MTTHKTILTGLATIALAAFSAPVVSVIAPAANASVSLAAETVVASGSWSKKSFASSGTWQIVDRDGTLFVVLSDDFRTKGAPDLKIFLSPLDGGSLNGNNATDGSVLISPLASSRGGQEYEIPADVDVSSFTSIIIHCEQYAKLWSVAAL